MSFDGFYRLFPMGLPHEMTAFPSYLIMSTERFRNSSSAFPLSIPF